MQTTSNTPTFTPLTEHELFAFGDSLVDIGRLFSLTQGQIPPSPYFDGRSSNGPLAVEQLAAALGINHSQAVNFAVAGSLTGDTNTNDTDTINFGGLQNQLEAFSTQVTSLGADANDLYLLWAGANDFLSLIQNPVSDVTAVLTEAVTNIATAVSILVSLGANNIVVAQMPNLGLVPLSLQAGLQPVITQLTTTFNTALSDTLTTLEANLGDANIILTDLFAVTTAIAADPVEFGFDNITDPYLNGLTPVDDTIDPNTYFFWDLVHPTTAVHEIFADAFFNRAVTEILDDLARSGSADADRLVGFAGDDWLRGRKGDDSLLGNDGDDHLWGEGGSDDLVGGAGADRLNGGGGNDMLRGGADSDMVLGKGGRDVLIGPDPDAEFPGRMEIDVLTGGTGGDTFALGNEAGFFYDDGRSNRRGLKDFAVITDLQQKDTIQLNGDADDYLIRRSPLSQYAGTGIFRRIDDKKELIGVVTNVVDLNLVRSTFEFV